MDKLYVWTYIQYGHTESMSILSVCMNIQSDSYREYGHTDSMDSVAIDRKVQSACLISIYCKINHDFLDLFNVVIYIIRLDNYYDILDSE